ncbi:MAG: thioesterase family protein, partial [Cyanobacteria bacterium]|nr:thioesterase family protein [Cyanobacteriota bacterium]
MEGCLPMIEYRFNFDVHIFDTDCFNVMWHGSYTKWLEMGRVNLFKSVGIQMSKPEDPQGFVYPVVTQNFKFKSPARMGDVLTLTTRVEVQGHKLIFFQECKNLETDKVTIEVETVVVVLDTQWKPLR